MPLNQFSRTQLLLGAPAMERLAWSRVAVFGVGGVGGYVVEGLVRSGVGRFVIVDDDTVCLTNANRQVIATTRTVGRPKVEVMRERMLDINPYCEVDARACFFLPENAGQFDFSSYDYVVDAVDTVTAKLAIVSAAKAAGVSVISCMGAGNKLDPAALRVADIYETTVDPLARVMRKECRKRGIDSLKVVFSTEPPLAPLEDMGASCRNGACICPPGSARHCSDRRSVPGSVAFVPSVAGLIIASEVVKDLARGLLPGQR